MQEIIYLLLPKKNLSLQTLEEWILTKTEKEEKN